LAGLGWLLKGATGHVALPDVFEAFLPPHARGPDDPFAGAEELMGRVASYGQRISLLALPAFLWFATRAFASVRTALNSIYDVSLRPIRRGFLLGVVLGKARDLTMVVATVVLFLLSTAVSTVLALAQAWGAESLPEAAFFVSTFGQMLGSLVAFGGILLFFFLLYRFGSMRRVRWRAALVASLFAGPAFEIARRLYAFYMTNVAVWNRPMVGSYGTAMLLFILWLYYSALVFLLGGVVAETWELRRLVKVGRRV
jgi:membrane protein